MVAPDSLTKDQGAMPAFPAIYGQTNGADGLTKREYFAAIAMQGILAGPCSRDGVPMKEFLDVPAAALQIADVMLQELSK